MAAESTNQTALDTIASAATYPCCLIINGRFSDSSLKKEQQYSIYGASKTLILQSAAFFF